MGQRRTDRFYWLGALLFLLLFLNFFPSFSLLMAMTWETRGAGVTDEMISMIVNDSGFVFGCVNQGGIYVSYDHGESWVHSNNGLGNTYVYDFAIDPYNISHMFAACRGGLWESHNTGNYWERVFPSDTFAWSFSAIVKTVTVLPYNPIVLLIGTMGGPPFYPKRGGRIFKRVGNSNQWQEVTVLVDTENVIRKLAYSPSDPAIIYAATEKGIFFSPDTGNTWFDRTGGLPSHDINCVAVDPLSPDTAYITISKYGESGTSSLYKTVNEGNTWSLINNGLPGGNEHEYSYIAIDPQNSNIIYVTDVSDDWQNGVYRSFNSGNSWEWCTRWFPSQNHNVEKVWTNPNPRGHVIAIDPNVPSRLYFGASSSSYRSDNNGDTWVTISTHPEIDDAETLWSNKGLDAPGSVEDIKQDFSNGDVLYAALIDQGLIRSKNGGHSWKKLLTDVPSLYKNNTNAILTDPNKPGYVLVATGKDYISSSTKFFISNDTGETWQEVGTYNCGQVYKLELDRNSSIGHRVIYAATHYFGLMKSLDGGISFNPFAFQGYTVKSVAVDPNNSQHLIAAVPEYGFYESENGGVSWNLTLPSKDPRVVFISEDGSCYAGRGHTENEGAEAFKKVEGEWTEIFQAPTSTNGYITFITTNQHNPQEVWIAFADDPYHDIFVGDGIFRSMDEGETWEFMSEMLPTGNVKCILLPFNAEEKVWIGMYGNGIWLGDFSRDMKIKENKNLSEIDVNAYPNPFYDDLHISFSLPSKENVQYRLSFYDVQGRYLRLSKQGSLMGKGVYLSMQSNEISNLPSGIYYLNLFVDSKQLTLPLIHIKR